MNFPKLLIIFLGVWINTAYGQGLSLFQDTENETNITPDTNNSRTPARRQENTTPTFTLRSTSRFGDDYRASIVHRDGTPIRVNWQPGSSMPVEGHRNYRVVHIGPRAVSIRLPSDERCVESVNEGVTCSNGVAHLKLAAANPIEARREVSPEDSGNSDDDEELIENPFSGQPQTAPELSADEQQERERLRVERARRLRNFEIVRISDDEVPPGMSVVRTPFGDRLVPEGEAED